jgi:hypothetical protein
MRRVALDAAKRQSADDARSARLVPSFRSSFADAREEYAVDATIAIEPSA